jgi:hypothetical protein
MYVCVGGGDGVVRCKSSPKEWNEYVIFPYLWVIWIGISFWNEHKFANIFREMCYKWVFVMEGEEKHCNL